MQETPNQKPSLSEAFTTLDENTEGQVLALHTKSLLESGNNGLYLPTQDRPELRATLLKLISLGFFTQLDGDMFKISDEWLKQLG